MKGGHVAQALVVLSSALIATSGAAEWEVADGTSAVRSSGVYMVSPLFRGECAITIRVGRSHLTCADWHKPWAVQAKLGRGLRHSNRASLVEDGLLPQWEGLLFAHLTCKSWWGGSRRRSRPFLVEAFHGTSPTARLVRATRLAKGDAVAVLSPAGLTFTGEFTEWLVERAPDCNQLRLSLRAPYEPDREMHGPGDPDWAEALKAPARVRDGVYGHLRATKGLPASRRPRYEIDATVALTGLEAALDEAGRGAEG